MLYTRDINNKEILLQDGNNEQVMMEWEVPYMNALIDNVKPKDMDVLEIGYGLGYSAKRIQSYKPKSHTIIECSNTVISKANKDKLNIKIVEGKWQDRIHSLGEYDFIFFDDHSYNKWDNELDMWVDANRTFMFIDLCIEYHLKKDGVISFYSNREDSLVERFKHDNRIEYTEKSIEVDIPDNCNYKKNNKCIIPLVCKTDCMK